MRAVQAACRSVIVSLRTRQVIFFGLTALEWTAKLFINPMKDQRETCTVFPRVTSSFFALSYLQWSRRAVLILRVWCQTVTADMEDTVTVLVSGAARLFEAFLRTFQPLNWNVNVSLDYLCWYYPRLLFQLYFDATCRCVLAQVRMLEQTTAMYDDVGKKKTFFWTLTVFLCTTGSSSQLMLSSSVVL